MKSFRFKFSLTIWILLGVVLALSVLGLAWNIWSAVEYIGINTVKVVSSFLTGALCLLLACVSLSIMLYGKYVVKDKQLISYFGFIKSKFSLSEMTAIILFKKSNKLVAYFGEKKYMVIVISQDCYESFVLAVREQNKAIVYDVQIEGEDTPE